MATEALTYLRRREDLWAAVTNPDGSIKPGRTTIDNDVLAAVLAHVSDCRECPLLEDAVARQIDAATDLIARLNRYSRNGLEDDRRVAAVEG